MTLPPKIVDTLLDCLLPESVSEFIMGDFHEAYHAYQQRHPRWQAQIWYGWQALYALPALLMFRRNLMNFHAQARNLAFVSFVFALPALIFVPAGILFSLGLPQLSDLIFNATDQSPFLRLFIHPVVLMGGVSLAFLLNLLPICRVNIERQAGELVSTLRLRKGHWLNLTFITLSLTALAVMLLYGLAENFGIFA